MWLKDLLPLHVSHARIMTYGYSLMDWDGISLVDVRAVATNLLTLLHERYVCVPSHTNEPGLTCHFRFIPGRIHRLHRSWPWRTHRQGSTLFFQPDFSDFRILGSKGQVRADIRTPIQALSIAISREDYTSIAANTSLLVRAPSLSAPPLTFVFTLTPWLYFQVFFDTPHRVAHLDAWQSIASWLMFVSGKDFGSGRPSPDLQKTSQMLEEVNARFGAIDTIYDAVNVYYKEKSPARNATVSTWTWQVCAFLSN